MARRVYHAGDAKANPDVLATSDGHAGIAQLEQVRISPELGGRGVPYRERCEFVRGVLPGAIDLVKDSHQRNTDRRETNTD